MHDYRDVEAEEERRIRDRAFRGFPMTAGLVARARRYQNRRALTDDEVLAAAHNRLRLAESMRHGLTERLLRYLNRLVGRKEAEKPLRVPGQELKALMAMAGLKEEASITFNHEYEVDYIYYRILARKARAARGPG